MPNTENKKGFYAISDRLKKLSTFGMKYQDMVLKNSRAIGLNTNDMPLNMDVSDDYNIFSTLATLDTTFNKSVSIFDKEYVIKREELRNFSLQDEIEDILDTLTDECIIYDDNDNFCVPVLNLHDDSIKDDVAEKIKDSLFLNFKRIYQSFGFDDNISAWHYFRKWLIDGYIAFEIIYDDDNKNIIGFKELDPNTIEPYYKDGVKMWKQKTNQTIIRDSEVIKEIDLTDAQVIYISFNSINSYGRTSYVERLIRAFNILRIMEQSRIIWAVVNASYKTKFVIPVGGQSKTRARQSLSQLMQSYKQRYEFDSESGELKVNGKTTLPFNSEYWLPETPAGSPEIENIGGDGPDLSDTDSLKYFRTKLYKISKIPLNRFDTDSAEYVSLSSDSISRDEIKFGRFITRLNAVFGEIILKPLQLQMALDYPELAKDDLFKSSIKLKFNKYNLFEEMMEMDILETKMSFISTMNELAYELEDGSEEKYFSLDFLVQRWLKLNEEDVRKNKEYKEKEREEVKEIEDELNK